MTADVTLRFTREERSRLPHWAHTAHRSRAYAKDATMWMRPPKKVPTMPGAETFSVLFKQLQPTVHWWRQSRFVASLLYRDLMPVPSIPSSSQPVVGFTGLTQLTLYNGARVSHHASKQPAKLFQIECLFGLTVQVQYVLCLLAFSHQLH